MLGLVLAGCSPEVAEPPPPPPPAEGPCALAPDHALRVECHWSREGTGPIALHLSDAETGEARAWPGDPDAREVRIVAWDLRAGAAYDWRLVDGEVEIARGTLVAGPVPEDVDQALVPTVDGPSAIERVLIPGACGTESHLVVFDGDGRVRGWQATGATAQVNGVDATDRGTLLALVGRYRIGEWAFDGTSLLAVEVHEDEGRPFHHAVIGRHGRTLALDTLPIPYGDDGDRYLMDGVAEVLPDGPVHVWGLDEVIDDPTTIPVEPIPSYWTGFWPDALDFAHANGIWPEPDGRFLISLKHLDALLMIGVDGAIEWAVLGSDAGAPFADHAIPLASAAGRDTSFGFPHAPARTESGTILLLDNGRQGETARVLEIAVDEAARRAELLRDWDLQALCPVQGSARSLPDGSVLAWCPNTRELFELDDDGIRRRSTLTCANGARGTVTVRAIPMRW